jgi:hypothetical protein
MNDLGLGRKFAPDARDENYPMRTLLPKAIETLPTSKTWDFRGAVLDQGGTGTCTAHAAAHFVRSAPMRHKHDLNAFDIYREGVLLDEWGDNDVEATRTDDQLQFGSSGRGMVKALEARGIIKEYRWGWSVDEISAWVLTRGPVLIGTNWYEDFFNPTTEGFVKFKTPDGGGIAGGHETVVRAANRTKAIALVVNSWSARWNANANPPPGLRCPPGHFLIDFETLHRLIREGGDGVSPIEQKKAA